MSKEIVLLGIQTRVWLTNVHIINNIALLTSGRNCSRGTPSSIRA